MLDDDPHRAAARARLARGGRDRRRRDLLLLARATSTGRPGPTVSTNERLSSEGWQSCSSCHFEGLTDSIVWTFNAGPRKSVPLNATFNPNNPADQRVLNYSAIFDEVEDFEANIRNVSGPGALAAALACSAPPPATSAFDPNHGLLFGDNGDINLAPCVVNAFAKANAGRPQHTVTLPGSTTQVPALTALREWVKLAVRTPKGPFKSRGLANRLTAKQISQGRTLFAQAGCSGCHVGGKWTISTKDFTSPPAGLEIFTETTPPATFGAPDRRSVPEPVPARHRLVQPRRQGRAQPARRQRRRGREGDVARSTPPASRARRRTRSAPTTTATAGASASTSRRCSGSTPRRPTTTTAPARASPAWSAT